MTLRSSPAAVAEGCKSDSKLPLIVLSHVVDWWATLQLAGK
jgi:hypothetical protein